ncbi:MAG: MOSC domain-containing protein [Alphaproteobacteria bacterium]|nr:MOSC domain-containing protein [Alphaproteobacteria bacterium]
MAEIGQLTEIWRYPVSSLAGEAGDFPESRWPMGQEFAIGDARFKVIDPCKRCVFVTVRHGALPRDAGVLRAIAENNAGNLGVVCAVIQMGAAKRGDAVRMG